MQDIQTIKVKFSECDNYSLLDSGDGMKLENFAGVRIIRPEPKAWWKKDLPDSEWGQASASFDTKTGKWNVKKGQERSWRMDLLGFKMELRLNDNSKHVGIFPEQDPHWSLIKVHGSKGRSLLNIFGYTGAATLAALSSGFSVTHVDASLPSLSWAKKNLEISGMSSFPVRWILDDAVKFVRREIRRGKKYDAIILDPPAFGRGPKGEIWKMEASIKEFLCDVSSLLSDDPLFIILTIYNIEASSLMPANIFVDIFGDLMSVDCGELAIKHKNSAKNLPMSIYNICSKKKI
ncbi:MAG TPA: class I SAM-dependent methyltransferase [Victivallales bacterium]|nr:class I SAM-dependent methyltransferase [Victivallales bacterium]